MATITAPDSREKLLTPSEVCEVLPGITAATLAQMRRRGIGPKYVQRSRGTLVWYRVSDLLAWAKAMTRDPSKRP